MANGDLQATLSFQWAMIRHNGSSLAIDGLTGGPGKFNIMKIISLLTYLAQANQVIKQVVHHLDWKVMGKLLPTPLQVPPVRPIQLQPEQTLVNNHQ